MAPERLLERASAAVRAADWDAAKRALDTLRASIEDDPDEAVTLQCEALEARVDLGRGHLAAARRRAEAGVARARHEGTVALAELLLVLGEVLLAAGDLDAGAERVREARGRVEAPEAIARAELELGRVAARRGELTECEAHVAAAARGFEAEGQHVSAALALLVAADARQDAGDVEGAQQLIRACQRRLGADAEARVLATVGAARARVALKAGRPSSAALDARRSLAKLGDGESVLQARLWNLIGEAYRAQGDSEGALDAYGRSAELYEAAGHDGVLVPHTHEALVLQALGRFPAAQARLLPLVARCEREGRRDRLILLHALLMPCAVEARDWAAWGWHHRRAASLVAESSFTSFDAADAARRAGEMCGRAAWSGGGAQLLSRAVRAHALALELFRRLGREDEAVAAARALHELGSRGAPVPAGPFDLGKPLGRGAMGEVWRARHHDRRLVVAVKVVAPGQLGDERFQRLIEGEVRAVGGLDHPNVVRVMGTGTLGPEAEAVAHASVRGDSPWFAMEFAGGGTLEALCGDLPWPDVRAVLVALLDALAHAHARGVVHLDLKPANVLLRDRSDGHREVLLTDFGLARIVARSGRGAGVAGTPQYMAPEQFGGEHRDLGPWTDLYGLGCLAAHLIQGRPPFPGDSLEEQREAHLSAALPPLEPAMAVPDGLQGWMERLLQKAPRHRFQHAADAAWALDRLADPSLSADEPRRPRTFSTPAVVLSTSDLEPTSAAPLPPGGGATASAALPMPADWRGPLVGRPRAELIDAALPLFGLRRPPLVGRDTERDAMWRCLRDLAEGGEPRLLLIRGGRGVGKSALGRWLCERASELGIATVLDGGTGADGSLGLRGAVSRYLRLDGLQQGQAEARIRAVLPELQPHAAADLAVLAAEHGVALARGERVAAVAALVGRLAMVRPVIIRLDATTPSDGDGPALARLLVALAVPALVLLELAPGQAAPEEPPAQAVHIGPMPVEELAAVVDSHVPLVPRLRDQLVARAGGNPDLALQILGDLVRRDALTLADDGWDLRPGAELGLPAPVRRQWGPRVELAGRRLDAAGRAAAAGAVMLGGEVTAEAWSALCSAAGADPRACLGTLISSGIALSSVPRWTYAHPAAAALVGEAWADGEAARAAVAALPDDAEPSLRGSLLLRAGAVAEAAAPLLSAARNALAAEDPEGALVLLERRGDAMRGVGLDTGVEDRMLRARAALALGDASASQHAEAAAALAGTDGPLAAEAALLRALAAQAAGQGSRARDLLRVALDAHAALGEPVGQAEALLAAAEVSRQDGDVDGAAALLRRALSRLDPSAHPALESTVRSALGSVLVARRELDLAEGTFLSALHAAERAAAAVAAADALAGLGDVARLRGEPQVAEARYRGALERLPWPHVHRARVEARRILAVLAQERWAEAAGAVEALVAGASARERTAPVLWARLMQLPLQVRADDPTWRRTLAIVEEVMAEPVLLDPDAAWVLELAGQRACEVERPDRAEQPWRLSGRLYARLGRVEDADRVARSRRTLARTRLGPRQEAKP